jgi:calcineurin-like phosphoesterase family protein
MIFEHTTQELEKVFFTADNHFGHENIIKFCNRPFKDAAEMDTEMVRRWNETVPVDGIVYHLGDFTLMDGSRADQWFGALNGEIRILGIPWHHDKRWLPHQNANDPYRSWGDIPVMILPPSAVIELTDLKRTSGHNHGIHLSHYPMGDWDRKYHGGWHLHGHSHGNYKADGYLLDIGVDCWDFRPVSFAAVYERFLEMGWKQ